jgi:Putative prokaryotic signal transducing protein
MMQDHDEIIVFQRFNSAIDANIVKSKLDAYGVPCFLTEENMANLYPGASNLMNSNVRLHLFGHDLERAKQIMAENNLSVNDDSILVCPNCRSKNIERDFPKNLTLSFASSLRFLFFGIFFPEKKVYRCQDCETEF